MDTRRRSDGQVVFITGAGRGQGRSHAVEFAREGASLALIDIGHDIGTSPIALSTESDLAETVALCEAEGAKVVSALVDVRDLPGLQAFISDVLGTLSKIDVVVANAGIFGGAPVLELSEEEWQDMIDVNLTGVWKTLKAAVPSMVERGQGRVIIIGSGGSLAGYRGLGHYVAAKHAVLGLARTLAQELGEVGITVNVVTPGAVHTPMVENPFTFGRHNPADPTLEGARESMSSMNAIRVPWIEPEEVSELVMFLASDAARHLTGTALGTGSENK